MHDAPLSSRKTVLEAYYSLQFLLNSHPKSCNVKSRSVFSCGEIKTIYPCELSYLRLEVSYLQLLMSGAKSLCSQTMSKFILLLPQRLFCFQDKPCTSQNLCDGFN